MGRRHVRLALSASLVLCVAISCSWIRSLWAWDQLAAHTPWGDHLSLTTNRGVVEVERVGNFRAMHGGTSGWTLSSEPWPGYSFNLPGRAVGGFGLYGTTHTEPREGVSVSVHYLVVTVPHWAILVAVVLPTAALAVFVSRSRGPASRRRGFELGK